jgi:hypothetical protein
VICRYQQQLAAQQHAAWPEALPVPPMPPVLPEQPPPQAVAELPTPPPPPQPPQPPVQPGNWTQLIPSEVMIQAITMQLPHALIMAMITPNVQSATACVIMCQLPTPAPPTPTAAPAAAAAEQPAEYVHPWRRFRPQRPPHPPPQHLHEASQLWEAGFCLLCLFSKNNSNSEQMNNQTSIPASKQKH